MIENKDNDREFIFGVSQGEYNDSFVVDDHRDNFMFRAYKECNEWYDYTINLQIEEKIDEYMRDSIYAEKYVNGERFSGEDVVYVYLSMKKKIQKELLTDSNVYLFIKVTELLEVGLHNVIMYVPLDEKYRLNKELEERNFKSKLQEKNLKLF